MPNPVSVVEAVPWISETHLLKPNAPNTLVFRANRTDVINELGTGGLLGPVGIYREK